MSNFWLLKAEPDSRVVKGKDVKFSVDDFESVKTTAWEGVRNHEAKNLMKTMKIGDKALFYHSNTANPGVAAFAEVSKEAYPDHTAWDSNHPYYDAKTNQNDPKWFMVDLTFVSKAEHLVPLNLLKYISTLEKQPPSEIEYIGEEGVQAIKFMDLVSRGRLSVQRVDPKAYDAISLLAQKGGWESLDLSGTKRSPKKSYKEPSENEFVDEEELPKKPARKSGARGKGKLARMRTGGRAARPKKKYNDEEDFDDGDVTESDFGEDNDEDGDYGSSSKKGSGKRKAGRDNDDGDYRASRPKKKRSTKV